ncbi:hypothetical protein H6P81_012848 [Aristolochia fimbriata]|uniref:Pectinesterase catalytic domain-containing protein n=1 Tax=Aristolochia fimbriata TaxID=158543 RepID=A0AAV7ED05_ARIFI|nr:hypothetical protein H6P81_012848 [Aristolochia fimbriata]
MQNQINAVTAQGKRDPNQNSGISIQNCTITAAPDLASNNGTAVKTYLGRPWQRYSRTVVMQSFIDTVTSSRWDREEREVEYRETRIVRSDSKGARQESCRFGEIWKRTTEQENRKPNP